jgi:hypothetical protein
MREGIRIGMELISVRQGDTKSCVNILKNGRDIHFIKGLDMPLYIRGC